MNMHHNIKRAIRIIAVVAIAHFAYEYIYAGDGIIFTDGTPSIKQMKMSCHTYTNTTSWMGNHTRIFCNNPVGVEGEWVHVPGRRFPTGNEKCCSWDNFPMFAPQEFCRQEEAAKFGSYTGETGKFYQQAGGRRCTCVDYKDEHIWKSPSLHNSEIENKQEQDVNFDAQQSRNRCKKLGNRTVLMIGDSTMQQTATVLMNSYFPTECQRQVRVALSDTAINLKGGTTNIKEGKKERGGKWIDLVKAYPSSIVIVSVGAHIRETELYMITIDAIIYEIMMLLEDPVFSNTAFAFKTQQPGGCTQNKLLSDNPAKATHSYNYSSYKSYQHEMFYERDLYLLSVAKEHNIPVMDMRMLYSRTDAKISSLHFDGGGKNYDCLHFCHPVSSMLEKSELVLLDCILY